MQITLLSTGFGIKSTKQVKHNPLNNLEIRAVVVYVKLFLNHKV